MKRTFIAIKIHPGEKMLDILNFFKKELAQEKIKWVDPGVMHITIVFLGDTDESIILSVSDIIKQVALDHPPFELFFRGTGIFRNMHDPRVIWIGTEINPVMQNIKAELDNQLSKFGFEKETREFKPHLTLGRIKYLKNRSSLEEAIKLYKEKNVQKELISELIYYESILKPAGPEYHPIITAPLSGK
jgi:RNA 2',3'-cyclic 3'-phosphodiesterase